VGVSAFSNPPLLQRNRNPRDGFLYMCRSVLVVFSATMTVTSAGAARLSQQMAHVTPYAANPRYWSYGGHPVLLLGGSKTDHIFLLDDLKAHLDEIVAVGGNYVRCTMSQREAKELKPHRLLENGKFDLNQWNDDYWARFERCLQWCEARDIIIQIEVWDRFDYSQEEWQDSPWRPANNVNYTPEESGLANAYPAPAWRDQQPFFHTIPGMKRYQANYDLVRAHQTRFVAKMLSYSLDYGNVLYCMDNETSTPPQWGLHWMQFIKGQAAEKGVTVYVTDMFDDGWRPQRSVLAGGVAETRSLRPHG